MFSLMITDGIGSVRQVVGLELSMIFLSPLLSIGLKSVNSFLTPLYSGPVHIVIFQGIIYFLNLLHKRFCHVIRDCSI